MSVFSEMKSISPTRPYLKPTIKTDSQGLSTTFQLEVPPRSGGQPVCGHPENTHPFLGWRSYCGETADEKQETAGFRLWTRKLRFVAVTRTAVLKEHKFHLDPCFQSEAGREKGPGTDPRKKGKEVLTGAESP
ncbi:unnamed protein product [Staurois parvus]|uniref:Uncharacterized protein n=1 Tax=Staurois parvus TaxID=386267 RepID=A0ABN9H931_9NEOB|nr:unnamed protein product [Staurois parvus]